MVNFYLIEPKHFDDLVPVKTFLEMFIHCAFLVGPAMLFGAVEEGRFCFSDVGFSTTWTLESIYKTRVAEKRRSILIRCIK